MSTDGLRVALTIGPPGHGGTATYSRELTRALTAHPDVTTITVGSTESRNELGIESDDHIEVPPHRVLGQARIAGLNRRLLAARADVFHGTRQVLPLRSPVPTVLTFHDDFAITRRHDHDLVKRLLLPPLYRRSLRIADAVVTLNPETAETAAGYVRAGVRVVDAGAAAPTSLTGATPEPPDTPLPDRYALVVGDCSPRKNVAVLLDEWVEVHRATDLDLVVAGGRAATRELRDRLISEAGVVFVERPTWGELAHLYGTAAVVVEPSADEGFGFAHAEAAHFGRPFVSRRDHTDLGAAIDRAIRAAAPNAGGDKSGWDEVARRTVEVYRAVCTAR